MIGVFQVWTVTLTGSIVPNFTRTALNSSCTRVECTYQLISLSSTHSTMSKHTRLAAVSLLPSVRRRWNAQFLSEHELAIHVNRFLCPSHCQAGHESRVYSGGWTRAVTSNSCEVSDGTRSAFNRPCREHTIYII